MPIETDFTFKHEHMGLPAGTPQPTFAMRLASPAADLLGPLRDLVGPSSAAGKAARTWAGTGYNMIWRPNHANQSGPNDFFLEMFKTKDSISFTDISGSTGVANRGLLQPDIFLGSLAYQQAIDTQVDGSGQHFEVGCWLNVPATSNPQEPTLVTRMGSIPHGTTINLQGQASTNTQPSITFPAASIVPFTISSPHTPITGGPIGDAMNLQAPSPSRSPLKDIPGVNQAMFSNPNLFLSQAIAGQKILKTTVLQISSVTSQSAPPTVPSIGGGVDNIAFLAGNPNPPNAPGRQSNADVPTVTATFWIEHVKNPKGGPDLMQLQYTQTVMLDFNGLSWPHVTVGTLTPQP